jgi:hypothetical protein
VTAAHRRAARREREAAQALGTSRVRYRPRYQPAPDCVPIRLPDGTVITPESATRGHLPRWLLAKVAQARRYVPGAVPCVVLSETGGEALALVPLRDLARLIGIRSPRAGEQLSLLAPARESGDAT